MEHNFKLVQEAYEALKTSDLRILYDNQYGRLDTNLGSHLVDIYVTTDHILSGDPYTLCYRRMVECECDGSDDCVYCEGKKIREDEVQIKIDHLWQYQNGAFLTIKDGGSVDRYGRIEPAVIRINHKLPRGMEMKHGRLHYSITVTDVVLAERMTIDKKFIKIMIPD